MDALTPLTLIIVYCLLILLASLVGGWIPLIVRLTHRRMEIAVSFVAGLMLGVGLLHMLPHALEPVAGIGGIMAIMLWLLAGFLVMFFIERYFCFHHHDVEGDESAGCSHKDRHGDDAHSTHQITWSGAAVGLTLHSVIAGVALAASVEAQAHGSDPHTTILAGFGTFIVIFLHKPFDSLTLGTLMAKGGWSPKSRHLINCLFALAIPVGAVIFHLGLSSVTNESHFVMYALAFSAGTFLCIAMSDLLPELQFHHHDRLALSLALILGLTLAWTIAHFEHQAHSHADHQIETVIDEHDHAH